MSRSTILSPELLVEFINQHPGRSFEWAVTGRGGIRSTAWTDFTVGDERKKGDDGKWVMPRGTKLIFRPKGTKGGVHCIFSDDGVTGVSVSNYDGPDEDELFKLWDDLKKRKQQLDDDEDEFRERSRKADLQIAANRRTIDMEREALEKSKAALDTQRQSLEKSIRDSVLLMRDVDDVFEKNDALRHQHAIELDSFIQRAQKAEQVNATAATISHVADRLQITTMLWRLKTNSKGEGIPPKVLEEIREGMMLVSLKRFYANVGEGEIQKLANSLAMCTESDKVNVFRAIYQTLSPSAQEGFLDWADTLVDVETGEDETGSEGSTSERP